MIKSADGELLAGITLDYNTHSYYLVDKYRLGCYHLNIIQKGRDMDGKNRIIIVG